MRFVLNAAGNVAGILVFYASKLLARIVNSGLKSQKIPPDAEKSLRIVFPGMQFDSIKIVYNAWLPAHIFNKTIEGMTFRNRIYIAHGHIRHHRAGLMLLIHEMVHIRQILDMGEAVFACKYGAQFLRNGGYGAGMPLEKEAYEFVNSVKSGENQVV